MKIKRRREVVVEKAEVYVVARTRVLSAWCAACGRQVDLIDLEEASRVTGSSFQSIQHRMESGEVHFEQTPEGSLLVCLNSLLGCG